MGQRETNFRKEQNLYLRKISCQEQEGKYIAGKFFLIGQTES